MKLNYSFLYFCLLRYIKKIKTIVFGLLNYKGYRIHYRTLFLSLLSLMVLLLCISAYVQRQISVISRSLMSKGTNESYYISFNITSDELVKIPTLSELKVKWVQNKIERMSKKMKKSLINKVADVKEPPFPNYRVHIFYYGWFRTQKEDGSWGHWNKELIKDLKRKKSLPPDDIYSSFYPFLGCYSSKNASLLDYHMQMIRKAGIGVVVISWVPPSFPDSPKEILHLLMDVALKYKIKVAFQIYYYKSRTQKSIVNQIKYLMLNIGNHPSLYLLKKSNKLQPVFYIHKSYKINAYSWKEVLSEQGNTSIRKTKYDGTFIGHFADKNHIMDIKLGSFDGLYTYSSGNGLTYGSSWKNWNSLAKFCRENALIFIPSVGPGFSDILSIKNTKHRLNGNYYEVGWRIALSVKPMLVGITSFNNWQDGSQIEPARPKKTLTRTYFDYEPEGPQFYVNLTRWWVKQYLSVD